MARKFVKASSQYLWGTPAALTAVPISMACWFKSDSLVKQTLLAITDYSGGSSGDFHALWLRGDLAEDELWVTSYSTASKSAKSTITYSTNTWQHACGVFAGNSDRRVYLDGGNKGTNADAQTPGSLSHTSIGHLYRSDHPPQYMGGLIAEAAIWNIALTDAEVAILAKGYSPLLIRPQNLVMYVPLIRDDDEDIVGGLSFTAVNTPTVEAHPRVFYIAPPSVSHITFVGAQTVTLNALTLASSVPSASVQATVTVDLNALTLASSVPAATVTPGEIIINLAALTLAGSVPSASVTPGAVTVALNALTLAGSVPSATVTPGAVIVALDALTLASSTPSATITGGETIITLDALTLASTLVSLAVTRGAVPSKIKAGWPFWRF